MQLRTWTGGAELFVYRSGNRQRVTTQLYFNPPASPSLPPTWAGSFESEPFTILALGKAMLTLANGLEAEVMVEGFDSVTGKGNFFGASAPPF